MPVSSRACPVGIFTLSEAHDPAWWDAALACSGNAHPSQSWAWGAAKARTGIPVLRIQVADEENNPLLLAQIFIKKHRRLPFSLGWIPRGPVWCNNLINQDNGKIAAALRHQCARRGIHAIISQPYLPETPFAIGRRIPWRRQDQTFFVDLRPPLKQLEQSLQKSWKAGKNRFVRDGGTVTNDRSEAAVEPLIQLYAALVSRKQFPAYGGPEFIRAVWSEYRKSTSPLVSAHVFHAMIQEKVCSSIMVLRAGSAVHYVWGASDYELRRFHSSEGIHWSVMETFKQQGAHTYDLGGADEQSRSGVFEFKRHMGGQLVTLPSLEACLAF